MKRLQVLKFISYCGLILISLDQSIAQTINDNYIKTYKALIPISGDLSTINDKTKVQETIEYFDGLGRQLQSIARQGSPLGYDIVSISVYDAYGRKTKSYLPYASTTTDGNLKSTALTDQAAFYQNLVGADGASAFSVQMLENSELGRLLKQSAPGGAWQPGDLDPYSLGDHTVKKRQEVNAGDEIYAFTYNAGTGIISRASGAAGSYAANQLSASKTIDENQNEVIEYMDKEGRTVCKKVQVSGSGASKVFASTYYVYDDLGNLAVVLPPEAVTRFTQP